MRLSDDTYEFIKGEVCDMFVRYKVNCVPICGHEIAIKMGMIVIPYSSLSSDKLEQAIKISSDGFCCEPGDGTERIYYNDRVAYERSNMTILHEIGHLIIGHTEDMSDEEKEAEAGFFAKYAAAPPPLIHNRGVQSPEELSDVFRIGFEASWYAWGYYCT